MRHMKSWAPLMLAVALIAGLTMAAPQIGGGVCLNCMLKTGDTATGTMLSSVSSGTIGWGCSISNSRCIDFGAGANDYAGSDGTTVTFGGPIASPTITASSAFALGSNASYTIVNSAWTRSTPTVAACTGAAMTWTNGTAAFQFDVGTACAGSTATVTFFANTNGWVCTCSTTTADRQIEQKTMPSAANNTATLTNVVTSTGAAGNFADNADVACQCTGG